jgi:predicted DNA-binding protein (UPF0251 family)/DNA-directed RNA polymerase subunit RPC12/RpoP
MPRPKICRRVHCEPRVQYFKPRGVPLAFLQNVSLMVDEFEAIRLKDLEGLEQKAAAESMHISQPTFHRVIGSARKKMADALINGKAIRIEGGDYMSDSSRRFKCYACGREWDVPHGTERPDKCPNCGSTNVQSPRGSGLARGGRNRRGWGKQ